MKKIGIITIVDNNNYGNRLQNYATVKIYEKFGYIAETLVLNPRRNSAKYLFRAIRMMIIPIKEKYRLKKSDVLTFKRILRFREFNKKNHITIKTYPFWNPKVLRKKYKFFSVGSDQIWNPNLDHGYGIDFLDFAMPSQRITLSPSFGVDHISPEKQKNYVRGLKKFQYLSVREKSGADLIKSLTGQDATVLIDPTMLLSKEEWKQIECKPANVDVDNSYILEYFLGGKNDSTESEISDFAKLHELKRLQTLCKDFPELYCTNPGEFIYLIEHAKVVFTDSFHAVVFSIIFGKPFVIYERKNQKEMGSRIITLLKKVGLEDRTFAGINENTMNIDYKKCYDLLENEKKKAYDFLCKSMSIK